MEVDLIAVIDDHAEDGSSDLTLLFSLRVFAYLNFKKHYGKFYLMFLWEIQSWPNVLVKKVTMQCIKTKIHTDACYPCKITETNYFSPILVTSVNETDSSLF